MSSPIPVSILLAKERAGSFRRCLEILHSAFVDEPPRVLVDLMGITEEVFPGRQQFAAFSSQFVAIEWALEWANRNPPPPIAALREARAILKQTAEEWVEAARLLDRLDEETYSKLPAPYWMRWPRRFSKIAEAEKRRIAMILEESWPVGEEAEEQKALAEMKAGRGLELDEAFAQISGVSKDEWEKRVAEHKSKKQ